MSTVAASPPPSLPVVVLQLYRQAIAWLAVGVAIVQFVAWLVGAVEPLEAVTMAIAAPLIGGAVTVALVLAVAAGTHRLSERWATWVLLGAASCLMAMGLVLGTTLSSVTKPLQSAVTITLAWIVSINATPKVSAFFMRALARQRALALPPGFTLRRVLSWLYNAKTMARVFDPVFADLQDEWLHAQIAGRRRLTCAWIRARGYVTLIATVWAFTGARSWKLLVDVYRALK